MHTLKQFNRILYTGTASFEIIDNVNNKGLLKYELVRARIMAAFTRSEKKIKTQVMRFKVKASFGIKT